MEMLWGLQNRRVLVLGGDGFIGARLVLQALSWGAHVTALCRSSSLKRLRPDTPNLSLRYASLQDASDVERLVSEAGCSLLLNAAGLVDWRQDPALTPKMIEAHIIVTANLLEAARKAKVERVVLLGSVGEYGAAQSPCQEEDKALPLDPYSVTKLAATELGLMYARSFSLPCTIVRPFQVYGPGESAQRLTQLIFTKAKTGGGELALSLGEQLRDFVFVDDVAEGILRAALTPEAAGVVLNLCTGAPLRLRDFVQLAVEVSGGVVSPIFGAQPYRPGEPMALFGSTQRLEKLLGWRPQTTPKEGLTRMWGMR